MLLDVLFALFLVAVVASLFLEKVGDPFTEEEWQEWRWQRAEVEKYRAIVAAEAERERLRKIVEADQFRRLRSLRDPHQGRKDIA